MTLHFIRSGDTLQSVADQINLENPIYIKEFHNQNCAREDLIDENLIAGKKLFLPNNMMVQKYNSRNDAPFKSPERNPKINFNPENLHSKYKVSVTESSSDGGKQSKNSFSYEFSLKWVKNEFGSHIFHFSKSNFSNRNQTKMGDLAIGCIQSINPIEIHTNQKGEIVRINLLKDILENFPKIKEKLIDQFPDQYAEIYIDEFEYVVQNEELFQKKIKEDWAIKTYFAHIRNDFNNGDSHLKMLFENEHSLIDINQTVEISENENEVILNQTSSSENIKLTGKYTLSKDKGLIKFLEIYHSYSQYGVLYSTNFKVDQIL